MGEEEKNEMQPQAAEAAEAKPTAEAGEKLSDEEFAGMHLQCLFCGAPAELEGR